METKVKKLAELNTLRDRLAEKLFADNPSTVNSSLAFVGHGKKIGHHYDSGPLLLYSTVEARELERDDPPSPNQRKKENQNKTSSMLKCLTLPTRICKARICKRGLRAATCGKLQDLVAGGAKVRGIPRGPGFMQAA